MSKISPSLRALAPAVALSLVLVGCADKADEGGSSIDVKATDSSCELASTEATTGSATFNVSNTGTKTNEFYIMSTGGRVLGEVENIGPGASRKLIVEFQEAGDYTTLCKPGMVGEGISGTLKVTGDSKNATEGDAALTEAVDSYTSYVRSQAKNLDEVSADFVDAVKAGDVDKAKELFPQVRTPYERIEPVASSFPNDLDPRLDLREADLGQGDKWTGFHAIEKDLWKSNKITDKTKKNADQLTKDLKELVDGVNADDFKLSPVQIATGAQGLLDEIATSKITGEEDIFSHTDLYDFQANLEGSRAALASLEKPLEERKPGMLKEINSRFDAVQAELNKHSEGEGFVSYDKVSDSERKALSTALDHLTEEVSKVQSVIAE